MKNIEQVALTIVSSNVTTVHIYESKTRIFLRILFNSIILVKKLSYIDIYIFLIFEKRKTDQFVNRK